VGVPLARPWARRLDSSPRSIPRLGGFIVNVGTNPFLPGAIPALTEVWLGPWYTSTVNVGANPPLNDSHLQAYGTTPYGGQGQNYEYDLANELVHERRTNGTVTYYGYDLAGRMSLIQHRKSDGTLIERWDYTRDEVGNILQELRGSDSMNMYWNYDQGNRISKEAWRTSGGTDVYGFTYSYDKAWNRNLKQQTVGSATSTYWNYDLADQPTIQKNNTTTTVYYTYDNCGNVSIEHDIDASAGRSYYSYDARNLVTLIDFPGATATNYFTYNALAERIRKDDSTGGKKYTWDGNDVILEKDLTNATLQRIVKGLSPFGGVGNSILQVVNGTVIYPHKNQVGTTMRQTDASQNIANYYEYDAWGQPLVVAETVSQQYRYTGKELDPDFIAANSQSRRYHFPARFYVPFRAIFAQIDPQATRSAGTRRALYLYVMANPLMLVDPDGREWFGSGGATAPIGEGLGGATWSLTGETHAGQGQNNASGQWGVGQLEWGVNQQTGGGGSFLGGSGSYSEQITPSGVLQTWVCPSGAVYRYIDLGGGAIQNPCLSGIGGILGGVGAGNTNVTPLVCSQQDVGPPKGLLGIN
jgi:RHS repeat-associated protein